VDKDERSILLDLSEPDERTIETLRGAQGDLALLGAGGKIGHGLALMARRAFEAAGKRNRVLAVSRFTGGHSRQALEEDGIAAIACDLSDAAALARLGEASEVLYLAGRKFGGSGGGEAETWFQNAYLPGVVAQRFPRSRWAAYSSGNVYPFWPAGSEGPSEGDEVGPVGEYAQSVLGRERVFERFSRVQKTPLVILRLNYANEPRYGVLVDIAARVLSGEPVDLTTGWVNVLWQGDSNRMTLSALGLAQSPPAILNLAGPKVRVRAVAETFGRLLGVAPRFTGEESATALLSDGSRARDLFGPPRVGFEEMVRQIAAWLEAGGKTWKKPTRFEVRDGKF